MEDQVKSTFEIMSETVWGWLHAFVANVPNIIVAVLVFLLTILLSRLIRRSIKRWMSRTRASLSVTNLVSNLGAIVIIIGGLYLGLTAMNLEGVAQGILATASISGLIVGLALQNTFANTFAGIILSLIDDVQIGDWIESKGFSGEVQRISLRNTTVKGPDGNFIFIPNKDILDNPLRNLAKTSRSRILQPLADQDRDADAVLRRRRKIFSDVDRSAFRLNRKAASIPRVRPQSASDCRAGSAVA
jgi:small conductance mechanosensitive channel